MVAKGKAASRHVMGYEGLPKYVFHPEVAGPANTRGFLEGIDGLLEENAPPRGVDEVRLFKAMHYCAYRSHQLRGRKAAVTAASRRWIERRMVIRDHLITVNLGLCYEMLRRTRFTNVDEDDLLSEGLRALCDAVEAFDPWRGYRFSTYACNAIYRGFLRLSKMETRRASLISYGFDSRMDRGMWEMGPSEWDDRVYVERLNHVLKHDDANLTSLEKYILDKRFPDDANQKRQTLERIGRDIQVSKERVRQIQVSALEKLRLKLVAEPVLA